MTHLRECVYLFPYLFTSFVVHRNIITKIHKCVSREVRVYHFVVFRIGIKPFVLKKGNKYQGVVDRWKEAGAVKLT